MKSIVLCDDAAPEKVVPLCKKYKLGIEIQGFYNPNTIDNTDELIKVYKALLPQGIEKHFHAPFWDLCMGSSNKKIAEVTRYYFDYAYEVADKLGCKSITVHHGFIPHTSYPAGWIKRTSAFWEDFFKAHPGEIKMYMENQCEVNPETLIGIVDTVNSDRLAVNLDIGHAHCIGGLPVLDWIEQLGNRIKYVHLHQNYGTDDEHFGLRNGNMPIDEVLSALERNAPDAVWAIECTIPQMEDSIEFLIEKGYIRQK